MARHVRGLRRSVVVGVFPFLLMAAAVLAPPPARAAPYAAMVVDARNGEVLRSRNADARLHPASLTKMMTLYLAFQAVEHGEIGLDTVVTISRNAASEPPSKLGLRPGQRIRFRYLIRAASVKSANDAATAIGEALSGSEAAFARRMTRMARAMGMSSTTFKNAHGLTAAGHLSTARDMTLLGRHILHDYPQYYNLFSRLSTNAGMRIVHNTNRRFLRDFPGADGIKTGFTNAAGFNLVGTAKRGDERIIATVFGGKSSGWRMRRVEKLLRLGFKRAPSHVTPDWPRRPAYDGPGLYQDDVLLARSRRPLARPARSAPSAPLVAAMRKGVADAVEAAQAQGSADPAAPEPDTAIAAAVAVAAVEPRPRPADAQPAARRVVSRASSSGGHNWGVTVGTYPSRYAAERALLKTALTQLDTLDTALRKVVRRPRGFEANFVGMTQAEARRVCSRRGARDADCETVGPPG